MDSGRNLNKVKDRRKGYMLLVYGLFVTFYIVMRLDVMPRDYFLISLLFMTPAVLLNTSIVYFRRSLRNSSRVDRLR